MIMLFWISSIGLVGTRVRLSGWILSSSADTCGYALYVRKMF